MYIPKQYILKDEEKIRQVIDAFSFATLVSTHAGLPTATHLPLYISADQRYLYGHFARANPQWKDGIGQPVLAVFSGPHSYISSSWYETKDAVPTLNYVAVHVSGVLEPLEEEQEIRQSLTWLVGKYELPDSPYDVDQVDEAYMNALLKGIVPFKIRIVSVEAAAKLSQGHSKERQNLVIDALLERNEGFDCDIASFMKENQSS